MKIVNPNIPYEFTFDDILLLPGYSDFDMVEEPKIDLRTRISKNILLDVPLVSSPMAGVTETEMAISLAKNGGIGIIHCFQPFERQLQQVEHIKKLNLKVGASVIDLTDSGFNHCKNLAKVGVDFISIDVAHAGNTRAIELIKKLKKTLRHIDISVSLVVTKEATEAVIKAGADSVRVGIGGGSHCTTRLVTGVGRPQLSAVMDCAVVAKKYKIPLISDTGIRYPGDIAKAIAFGADTIMIGGLFSGTDESPGEIFYREGKPYKMSWGSCTETAILQKQLIYSVKIKGKIKDVLRLAKRSIIPKKPQKSGIFEEGIQNAIPYKGSVNEVILNLVSGLRRSMWYMGVLNLDQLKDKARVVITSPNTYQESLPRI